jgi:hypothetical protein
VLVKGKLNIREDRANSLLIDSLTPLRDAGRSVYIKFPMLDEETMRRTCSFLKQYSGQTPVILYDASKKIAKGVPKEYYVDLDGMFREEAMERFGTDSVVIK